MTLHKTQWYSPGPRWNAPRHTRPPGSRTPDDFPPCLLLEHGTCKAHCSLSKPTHKYLSREGQISNWWSTDPTPDDMWGKLIGITCEWRTALIESAARDAASSAQCRTHDTRGPGSLSLPPLQMSVSDRTLLQKKCAIETKHNKIARFVLFICIAGFDHNHFKM